MCVTTLQGNHKDERKGREINCLPSVQDGASASQEKVGTCWGVSSPAFSLYSRSFSPALLSNGWLITSNQTSQRLTYSWWQNTPWDIQYIPELTKVLIFILKKIKFLLSVHINWESPFDINFYKSLTWGWNTRDLILWTLTKARMKVMKSQPTQEVPPGQGRIG